MTAVSNQKLTAAIVGPSNIGTDLMFKLLRSEHVEPRWMIGVDPASEGLRLAAEQGLQASHQAVDWLLEQDELPDLVFEATSAYVQREYAPRYEERGIRAVDLTPAAVGPAVIPPVNGDDHVGAMNVNMITCGGQATIPMVAAVSRAVADVGGVSYAEIVASVSSMSAGPGTRANIDEFTRTTAAGVQSIGGAARGKAIIILNPAEPPLIMRDTVFALVHAPDPVVHEEIARSVEKMVADVAAYVPGYRLKQQVQIDEIPGDQPVETLIADGTARPTHQVSVFLEVEGAAHYLPAYAGNLDIMTSAALQVAERIAARKATA